MKKKNLLMTAMAIFGLALISKAQVPNYVPASGLVGWWPFNGNANDESGNGNNGLVNGATLTNDRFGSNNSAYNFTSDAENINCGNSPSLGLTTNSSLTISYWTISSNNNWPFISKYQNNVASNSNFAVGNASPNFVITGNGQNNFYMSTTIPITWVHLCFVYNGNIDSVSVYLNGNFIQTNNIFLANNISTSALLFGPRFGQNTPYQIPNGNLDDIGIWNRAITQQEITALYISDPSGSGSAATNTVPAGISYQAVARNAQGQPLSDAAVQVKFTLLTDSLTGAAEYSESHSLTTNSLGLFTTALGAGTVETGTFAGINWASGSKYLKVELDAGDGFVDMGTQQLLSVPYSMRSNTSAKAGTIENAGLPVYANNAAALAGGLVAGQLYRTATGDLKIVY